MFRNFTTRILKNINKNKKPINKKPADSLIKYNKKDILPRYSFEMNKKKIDKKYWNDKFYE